MTRARKTPKLHATPHRPARRGPSADAWCIVAILAATLAIYAPALFGGKVLLPADTVLLMRPWGLQAAERYPEFHVTQNQMHGPIYEYYSWRHLARSRILAGEVPLWNPYELGGNVLLANSQSAVLYPPNLLLYILPLPVGINWVTALHTFLTGLFLFLFLRSVRMAPPAALAGAFVWMFCGVQTSWTEFQTPTAALCWMPGLLLCWQRFRATGRPAWAVGGGGLCVALTLLAGHLHFAFYVLLAYGLFALMRGGLRLRGFGVLAASLALGVGLSMGTMLPVFEMGRINFRAGHSSYDASVALRLPAENLATLLLPNVLGNPRDHVMMDAEGRYAPGTPYQGKYDFIEYSTYLGVVGLALAGIGLVGLTWRRRRSTAWRSAGVLCLIAAVGMLLALGTPLCAVLFYGAPGYRQFNATARALCLFSFGMSCLAAYGVHWLVVARRRITGVALRVAGAVCGLVALAGILAFAGVGRSRPDLFQEQWAAYQANGLRHALAWTCLALMLAIGAARAAVGARKRQILALTWLLPVAAASDLVIAQWGFNPVTNPEWLDFPTAVTDYLKTVAPDRVISLETPGKPKGFIVPNYNATLGIREAQGADSLHTKRYHRWMESIVLAADPGRKAPFTDPNTIHTNTVSHPALDALNVAYVTTEPRTSLPPEQFERVLDAELTVWRNKRACGPAWIVDQAIPVADLDEAFGRMSSPGFDPRRTAPVEGPVSGIPVLRTAPPGPARRVTVASFAPHAVALDVEAGAPGLLVLSETMMPGWRATVNGAPTPIRVADGVLRAVPVPQGPSAVRFRYEPASYRVGLYLSVLSLAALAGLVAAQRMQPKARSSPTSVRL